MKDTKPVKPSLKWWNALTKEEQGAIAHLFNRIAIRYMASINHSQLVKYAYEDYSNSIR